MASLGRLLLASLRDFAPVLAVILFFQVVVLGEPVGELLAFLEGAVLVVVGLTLLLYGLQLALFPMGELLATALAERGSFVWLIAFAFLLGFGTTIAEPALTAVSVEAAKAAVGAGTIENSEAAKAGYALALRLTVASAVGVALVLGVVRIVLGWPLPWIVAAGYAAVIAITFLAPAESIGIAYDVGGVTTSVITVPLVSALGIGLASSLFGRNPMIDGFGMVVIVILMPMIFVMGFAAVLAWI